MPDYMIGCIDPLLKPDKGSGSWCSQPQTTKYLIYKRIIEKALALKLGNLAVGEDASRHFEHYFNNTGSTIELDLLMMISTVDYIEFLYDDELRLAKKFAESLPDGRHHITSKKHGKAILIKKKILIGFSQ